MAELEKLLPNHPSGLEQILQEAKHRWLRPAEVCEILRNYQTFQLKPEPPVMPPAGSLFLFDRKALRYFRKDGYRWRKKKDGKTVKEAHEKLKTGSVDSLHCYYAHGEENESFQRRSYWMLDEKLEHIVLVHYREIKEGYKSGISRLLPGRVDCNVQLVSSEHEDVDLGDKPGTSSLMQPPFASSLPQTLLDSTSLGYLFSNGVPALSGNSFGSLYPGSQFPNAAGSSSVWDGGHNSIRCENSMQGQGQKFYEQTTGADFITCKLLGVDDTVHDLGTYGDRLISNTDFQVPGRVSKGEAQGPQDIDSNLGSHPSQKIPNPQMVVTFADQVQKSDEDVSLPNQSTELKKLDSFGRWMDVTIGVDCSDSLMASDSGNYWNTLDGGNDDKEVSSLSHHIQLDVESLGPSLSLEQLFSIIDFSPDWAYSGVGTKVLIVGRFLGGKQHCAETKWGCMFGEVEVPAEVVVDNVLRCITTLHAPGRVPFYVTCSNRLACSEVREFEYREIPRKTATNSSPEAELRLQIRLGKLLNLGSERNSFNCSVIDCDKCKLQKTIYSMKVDSDLRMPRDLLIRNLLSDRLCEWLVSKIHEIGKGPHVLDDEGQGVIHLAASLGYHWAMGPIVAAGVSPNFRDARGMTGLHWASCFGREETVVELVRLGASPGAVDDPTPAFPGGKTAADLASSSGHKGIAGYLAEADLIRQLHQLNIDDNAIEVSAAATIAAENATNVEAEEGVATDDQSMKGSLAAVRKSALAASLVQNAFRNRSFRHRQSTTGGDIIPDDSLRLASLDALHKGQKFGHFEDSLHSAAKNIQKRYRGWRGRNDFLDLRSRVVKIQAHVRGHQARKQYKKVVWSVGIVEKVILRWRRKGVGLRGFRAENSIVEGASTDIKRSDEYEFLRIGRKQKSEAVEKAFARVKSMVRHPEAREQYMRLVSNFEKLEMGGDGTSASHGVDSSGKSVTERDSTEFPNDQ